MKKLALFSSLFFVFAPAASAVQINSRIVDSVQLTVDGAAVQTTRTGSSYNVSGSGISVTTLGGLTDPTHAGNAHSSDAGSYSLTTAGGAFTFTENAYTGDNIITDQNDMATNGRFAAPVLYGESTTMTGGSHGDLAGTLTVGGVPTVTAGGVGTTAIGQRTVELSVFR
jgi:hypothetical protein